MMEIKEKIKNYKSEMINNLSKLISYETVLSSPQENAPFGIKNLQCLNEILNIAKSYNLRTKNLDGYCGYVEIGDGKEIIGILTHSDVVPSGNGWDTDPFKATIKNNKIYGRGTSDDKGAIVASLTALKILNDNNINLNKRIRLIIGCNEETGSKCMKHYIEKEGNIDIGFTPDGIFPVVHGEKGQVKAIFRCENLSSFSITGGIVENAISDNCRIQLESNLYDKSLMKKYFDENNIQYSILSMDNIDIIEVKGISAHASTPELGINAISYAIMALKSAGYSNDLVEFYSKYIGLETDGKSFGIKCNDEYGDLTFVNGKISTEKNQIIGTIDIRVPVSLDVESIVNKMSCNEYKNANIEITKYSRSLFFPINSEIVETLMKVYQEVTGDMKSKPISIGGGTYAKSMKNCLAFGCAFPNTNNQIHNANEFVDIDELLLQTELYINAILGLLKLNNIETQYEQQEKIKKLTKN